MSIYRVKVFHAEAQFAESVPIRVASPKEKGGAERI
jgi:hypothetical protein